MREAESEKVFMERETKKLKESMKKDKEEFLEQMVAETKGDTEHEWKDYDDWRIKRWYWKDLYNL